MRAHVGGKGVRVCEGGGGSLLHLKLHAQLAESLAKVDGVSMEERNGCRSNKPARLAELEALQARIARAI